MDELTIQKKQLPDTIEDLSKFVLVNEERVQALRAQIRAIKKVNLAKEVYEQKLAEAQEIGEIVVEAGQKMGELLLMIQKQSGGDRKSDDFKNRDVTNFEKSKTEITAEMGMTKDQVSQYQQMAQNPEAVQAAIQKAIDNGDVVSRSQVMKEIKFYKDRVKALSDENTDLRNRKPEIRTIEKEVEVFPEDYEDLKRSKEAHKKDYAYLQKQYEEMAEKWKKAEREKEALIKKKNEPEEKRMTDLKNDCIFFCTGVRAFLEKYGGYVYLKNEIDMLPETERKAYYASITAVRTWSDSMLNEITVGV